MSTYVYTLEQETSDGTQRRNGPKFRPIATKLSRYKEDEKTKRLFDSWLKTPQTALVSKCIHLLDGFELTCVQGLIKVVVGHKHFVNKT
ncbi:hypothetical protein CHS0354_033677, partial [Potamilus streckersoni]